MNAPFVGQFRAVSPNSSATVPKLRRMTSVQQSSSSNLTFRMEYPVMNPASEIKNEHARQDDRATCCRRQVRRLSREEKPKQYGQKRRDKHVITDGRSLFRLFECLRPGRIRNGAGKDTEDYDVN